MSLAMLFPGQGSQATGMQAALAGRHDDIRSTYEEAGDILGFDLWHLVQNGPAARLNATVMTQPAMLAAGVATWRAWQTSGGASPRFMAGHSLGEYTALVCAGSLGFPDAMRLVRQRAELMQAAVPEGQGAMAAILGLDDEAVVEVCRKAAQGQVVSAVNFNSPGQVIVAGDHAAVERATALGKAAGAKRAVLLNVSVPAHSALMRPAAAELTAALAATTLSKPSITVINNVDVAAYETVEQIRDGLARQLYSPVRWAETVRKLIALGSTSFVEAGPGAVLARLVRRIDRSVPAICIDSPETLREAIGKGEPGEPLR